MQQNVQVSIIATLRNTYYALGEFFMNDYYIENNQLVLEGVVVHLLSDNGNITWVTDGQLQIRYRVIGSK